ncbi:PREDICTED: pre-mRNA-splicing factor prp12 [Tarenaya hassleriana]|uniref:pre-mRNA-splicing factor prp12 n=1 Tax=Tarenaya hassleriana TaxID=28532 RepID=UPI00053C5560|nr:PREDICTED: pre-mRNA-splicing factor prp12 [Tarenaya hassleriana]
MAVPEEESYAKSQSTSATAAAAAAPSSSGDVCYLAKCVLRPSVVLQVAYGYFRSRSFRDIVFGKETCIELVSIGEDGIVQSVCEQSVFGTIKDLAVIPWNNEFHMRSTQISGKDLLAVISDSGKLSFLSFSNEMHRFSPVSHVQLSSPGNSTLQLGRMLAVDSSGLFLAASAYHDHFGLFSLSTSSVGDIINERIFYPSENSGDIISEQAISGSIWSMCFISKNLHEPSKEYDPVLAIVLNRKGSLMNDLVLFRWNVKEQSICLMSEYAEPGALSHTIVEVPHSYGFAFLFRVGDALLMDLRDAQNPCCLFRTSLDLVPASLGEDHFVEESCRVQDGDDEGLFNVAACALLELRDYDPMCIDSESGIGKLGSKHVTSWTWEPENYCNPRMIFCLDDGEFFMFELTYDSNGMKVNLSECLHKSLPCKEILWVEGGLLAAFVEMADGVVFKVETGKLHWVSPIQNIAPILDMSIVDDQNEKRDQMFACCGVTPEGSFRIIRSGISVEKLLKTAPIYQGITGTWTVRMKLTDIYHSFLVLSFVEETRVLSVGLSFKDVTDSVGFQPDVCTLACGLAANGLLVQIHQNAVRLSMPTEDAHSDGITVSSPFCTSWFPDNVSISLGAVGENLIVISTSNPWFLSVLGVKLLSSNYYEIYEMQRLTLQYEVSCISIPQRHIGKKRLYPSTTLNLSDNSYAATIPAGMDGGYTFVIGTHKPSVEVLSCSEDGDGLRILASGLILLTNTMGTAINGCIPQDVRLVLVDQFYVLCGLRNGMLLRFEWPTFPPSSGLHFPDSVSHSEEVMDTVLGEKSLSPINLLLIATRRIGITPVFLVPFSDSLDSDIIALSDRPWLLQTARQSLSYTSISFQPSTHATPVCSSDCPQGILFVAENCLHLVEMVHSKRLNVQKFQLGGTPRKVIYHSESKLLIVMRTDLQDTCASDVCCVDPLSGSVLSSYKLKHGETGKSMELLRVGNEQVLVVGTSLSSGPAILPSGEAESTKGRLIILCIEHTQNSDSGSVTFCSKAGSSSQRMSPFRDVVGHTTEQLSGGSFCSSPDDNSSDGIKLDEVEAWQLRLASATTWPGMVLAICPYLDRYFLASAGNAFYVCGFPNDNPERMKRFAVGRTRFMITSLNTYFTRIAVGDCRDGVLFYSYHEDVKKLYQTFSDPSQRLVADCLLMDANTAAVSDRKGSVAILSCTDRSEYEYSSPESNLNLNCAYYMGEIAMTIRKGCYVYKLPADDVLKSYGLSISIDTVQNTIIAGTLLGSIFIFVPISREEFKLLEAVQARLAVHPLTAPILGNDHNEFRSRENPAKAKKILDGDMLAQFLELTSIQQEAVLMADVPSPSCLKSSSKLQHSPSSLVLQLHQVVQLLERVHYALN